MTNAIPFGQASRYRRPSTFAGPWASLPAWIFKKGVWANLSGSEKGVLGVLVSRADNVTHQTRVNQQTLARESGVALRSISMATNRLAVYGAIGKRRSGNRMTYEIYYTAPEYIANRATYWSPQPSARKPTHPYVKDRATGQFTGKNTDDPIPKNGVELNPKNSDAA